MIGTGILTLSVIPNDCTIIIPSQNATGDGNGVSSELGIILAILAGGINAIGLNFQKLGHNSSPEDTLQYLKSRIWWIGFLFIIVAELVGSIAYGFSPASIVSALGATTVFFNSIISILFLKEKVNVNKLAGLVTILTGSTLLAIVAPNTTNFYDVKELMTIYTSPGAIAYFTSCVCVIIALHIWKTRNYQFVRLVLYAAFVSSLTVIGVRGIIMLVSDFQKDCDECYCRNTILSPLLWILGWVVATSATCDGGYIE